MPSTQGSSRGGPPAAIHPPTGATAIASPRNNCVYEVTRLAREYQNTIPRATGDNARQTHPSRLAQATKATDETTTNRMASRRLIAPRGSSRPAVLGFFASKRASTSRLKPIAALRAATMQATIQAIRTGDSGTNLVARSAPASANGSANTEWLNRTKEAYVRMRANIRSDGARRRRAPR
jgi:hypothetical protein